MRRWIFFLLPAICLWPSFFVAAAGESPNLLANADFRRSTNGETPDYWDVHHAAVMALKDFPRHFNFADQPSDPVPGARTLRIASPDRAFPFLYLMAYRSGIVATHDIYTFSVSVHGDREGMRIELAPSYEAIDEWRGLDQPIGRRWRRVQAVFRVPRGAPLPSPVLVLPSRGTYWISAPQLEAGAVASDFRRADDDEPRATSAAARAARDAAAFKSLSGIVATRRVRSVSKTTDEMGDVAGVRGLAVGGSVPPEWYFADAVRHGFNAIFFQPAERADGMPSLGDIDAMLRLCRMYGLKLVVGPAVMGARDAKWQRRLDAFAALVDRYREENGIFAWWVVDEPQAVTVAAGELRGIHDAIKRRDPSRPVFVNWNSDDVPTATGAEPDGALSSTDIYSVDCYPFMDERGSLGQCTTRLVTAFLEAHSRGVPALSFTQMYGTLDAYREPSPAEARFTAYLHLLFSAGFVGWSGRPNSAATWDALGRANHEMASLSADFVQNPKAHVEAPPALAGSCLYGRWRKGDEILLLVLHLGDALDSVDLRALAGTVSAQPARDYFDGKVQVASPVFGPWEARAFRLNAQAH